MEKLSKGRYTYKGYKIVVSAFGDNWFIINPPDGMSPNLPRLKDCKREIDKYLDNA